MGYILDTSAIIEILRKTERGKRIAEKIRGNEIATSVFSVYELLMGLNKGEQITELVNTIPSIAFEAQDAQKSSSVHRDLLRKGKPINLIDMFIASMALNRSLHIITCDRDFEKIAGLKMDIY